MLPATLDMHVGKWQQSPDRFLRRGAEGSIGGVNESLRYVTAVSRQPRQLGDVVESALRNNVVQPDGTSPTIPSKVAACILKHYVSKVENKLSFAA